MILTCSLISNRSGDFIPKELLSPGSWVEVFEGDYPPIQLIELLTKEDHLGIDGKHVIIAVNPNRTILERFTRLKIENHRLLIEKID